MGGFSTLTRAAFQWLWHHQSHYSSNHNDLFLPMNPTALDVTQLLARVVWAAPGVPVNRVPVTGTLICGITL